MSQCAVRVHSEVRGERMSFVGEPRTAMFVSVGAISPHLWPGAHHGVAEQRSTAGDVLRLVAGHRRWRASAASCSPARRQAAAFRTGQTRSRSVVASISAVARPWVKVWRVEPSAAPWRGLISVMVIACSPGPAAARVRVLSAV